MSEEEQPAPTAPTASAPLASATHDLDVDLILRAQHPGGAYPAAAGFSQYGQCWLRDGAFIAHAMDLVGEHSSAARFHGWVGRALSAQATAVQELITRAQRGEGLSEFDFLPARFTVEGAWLRDGWPNFQLDGYGQWLWSLSKHLGRTGRTALPADLQLVAELVVGYLEAFWDEPCYDAWEEYRSQIHTSTLASIFGGLQAISAFLPRAAETAVQVRRMVLDECVQDGHFVKNLGNPVVDASLLWVATPFGLVDESDARMKETVRLIERDLWRGGGLRRYQADTYYGGGEWLILTAWLAWHKARVGEAAAARRLLDWLEGQRHEDGGLPEQVSGEGVNERFLKHWTHRWGPPAPSLLWSHAMSVVVGREVHG